MLRANVSAKLVPTEYEASGIPVLLDVAGGRAWAFDVDGGRSFPYAPYNCSVISPERFRELSRACAARSAAA
jgi:hypothetical protein